MLDRANLLTLMKTVSRANPSASYSYNGETYSYDALNETLRRELNEYAGTWAQYRENKHFIFSLIEETLNDILEFVQNSSLLELVLQVFMKCSNLVEKRASKFLPLL